MVGHTGVNYTTTLRRFVSVGIIRQLSGRESRHGISGNVFLVSPRVSPSFCCEVREHGAPSARTQRQFINNYRVRCLFPSRIRFSACVTNPPLGTRFLSTRDRSTVENYFLSVLRNSRWLLTLLEFKQGSIAYKLWTVARNNLGP